MENRVAFCSACDRNVPVVVVPGAWEERPASRHDAEEAVICLDYGVRCTGALCPMFRVEGDPEPAVEHGTVRREARVPPDPGR